MKHTIQSGFVSYRKAIGKGSHTVISHMEGMQKATTNEDIENWHTALDLDDTNEIHVWHRCATGINMCS